MEDLSKHFTNSSIHTNYMAPTGRAMYGSTSTTIANQRSLKLQRMTSGLSGCTRFIPFPEEHSHMGVGQSRGPRVRRGALGAVGHLENKINEKEENNLQHVLIYYVL